ncbi:MAG: hypothetical protein ACYTEY_07780, partial [Planctomycetota bacterium]
MGHRGLRRTDRRRIIGPVRAYRLRACRLLKWGQLDEIPVPRIAEGLTGRAQIIFGRIVPGGGPRLG